MNKHRRSITGVYDAPDSIVTVSRMLSALLLAAYFIFAPSICSASVNLDSLITAQRARGGEAVVELFNILENPDLTVGEKNDLTFLLAYLPLGDMSISGKQLLANVRLARKSQRELPWGELVSEDLYRHFVLPHRVSQEPFVAGWRSMFYRELKPRVAQMTMSEAALEVNHWCHEKATFVQTSGRDQDALTTIRTGFGRCEEEMILAICALRAIGLPARQCYTPYWAHTDNNHAWVEVWADGEWHYFGACEPEPELDRAWFSNSVQRAMQVVSTAYGEYSGDESVLRRYPRSTLINSTSVYGLIRELEVRLLNPDLQPIPNQRLVFSLWNYGALMPALTLDTDAEGYCRLKCGLGDWFVSAGMDELAGILQLPGSLDKVELVLSSEKVSLPEQIDYTPPPKANQHEFAPRDSIFKRRLAWEDSIREADVWTKWNQQSEFELHPRKRIADKPDTAWAGYLADICQADPDSVLTLLEKSRGNWGEIFAFATGIYPVKLPSMGGNLVSVTKRHKADKSRVGARERWLLIELLTEKDLHDFNILLLDDHYYHATIEHGLDDSLWADSLSLLDEESRSRMTEYVLTPRINYEPSRPWRKYLVGFFEENPTLIKSENDRLLTEWMLDNIEIEEDRDRLGPPLAPSACLKLKRGTRGDIERLYVAFCRVRDIPARFDPVARRLQRWEVDRWFDVTDFRKSDETEIADGYGELEISVEMSDSSSVHAKYFRDWAVQEWDVDHLSAVDFGYHKAYKDMDWPRELPAGRYCLTSGKRSDDGSVSANVTWFDITEGQLVSIKLSFR